MHVRLIKQTVQIFTYYLVRKTRVCIQAIKFFVRVLSPYLFESHIDRPSIAVKTKWGVERRKAGERDLAISVYFKEVTKGGRNI